MDIKTPLFPHQDEFLQWADDKTLMFLADTQGLGKTLSSLSLAVHRKQQYGYTHCLIITGISDLRFNWEAEIKEHTNESYRILGLKYTRNGKKAESNLSKFNDLKSKPEEFFWLLNIEALREEKTRNLLQKYCQKDIIQMCIIDEIHKAKNPNCQQAKGIFKIKPTDRIALTGTPLINNPLDVFTILRWLDQEPLEWTYFKRKYCEYDRFKGPQPIAYRNLWEIQAKLKPIMLRRTKDVLVGLPPKIESIDYISMYNNQEKLYNEIRREIKQNLVDLIMINPNPLAITTRLRQATGCPELLSTGVTESCKLDRALELIEENNQNNGKTIVYSEFKEIIKLFGKRLQRYNPAYIYGGIDDRMSEINRFQNDETCRVIAGTTKALGTGFTLTRANLVLFLDSPWSPKTKEQAIDRAHRIGTTGTVNVITLVCMNTIDGRIEKLLKAKETMSDLLIDNKDIMGAKQLLEYLLMEDLCG